MAVSAALKTDCKNEAIALWPHRPVAAMSVLAANMRLTGTTSSAGRLFDAVSAIAGLCEEQSDEAQAAMLLEAAGGDFAQAVYDDNDFVVTEEAGVNVLDVTTLLKRLLPCVSTELHLKRFRSAFTPLSALGWQSSPASAFPPAPRCAFREARS